MHDVIGGELAEELGDLGVLGVVQRGLDFFQNGDEALLLPGEFVVVDTAVGHRIDESNELLDVGVDEWVRFVVEPGLFGGHDWVRNLAADERG